MAKKFALLEDDVRLIGQLLDWWRNQRGNKFRRLGDEEQGGSPEVYIARIPNAGIPAMNEGIAGTGSTAIQDNTASYTSCDIYKVDESGTVKIIRGLNRRVYNLGKNAAAGNQWAIVLRDAFGHWYLAGGAITEISFTIVTGFSFNSTTCTLTQTTALVTLRGRDLEATVI